MLNQEQEQAVKILSGPLCIIAGAGTGKTHTITQRISHLVKSGIPLYKILTLTFTNKAANEIRERLGTTEKPPYARKQGVDAGVVLPIRRQGNEAVDEREGGFLDVPLPGNDNVMTFHSLAARLLREFWKTNFTINDPDDPDTLDFDQLLSKFLEILQNPDILTKCQNLFEHILVDEYQGVNAAQVEILQKLSASHQNLCVVGDPDQTIYSWRGANPATMAKFTELYPDARTIILTQNYRNPPNILKSAETLIFNNSDRLAKQLQATKTEEITTKV